MPKNRKTYRVRDVVADVLKKMYADAKPSYEDTRAAWRRLVGEKAALRSWPKRLIRGNLLVEVENSGWMFALNLKKEQLLEGLVELLGAHRVKGLTFRIGEAHNA